MSKEKVIQRRKPTPNQLKEFWKHNINPITGWFKVKSDDYSVGQRKELETIRKSREKYNKE